MDVRRNLGYILQSLLLQSHGINVVDEDEIRGQTKVNAMSYHMVRIPTLSRIHLEHVANHGQDEAEGRKADVGSDGAGAFLVYSNQASNSDHHPDQIKYGQDGQRPAQDVNVLLFHILQLVVQNTGEWFSIRCGGVNVVEPMGRDAVVQRDPRDAESAERVHKQIKVSQDEAPDPERNAAAAFTEHRLGADRRS